MASGQSSNPLTPRKPKAMNTITVPEKAKLHAAAIHQTDPHAPLQAWYWDYSYGIGEGYLRSVSKLYFESREDAERDLAASQEAEISLRSLDIGFDPRVQRMAVKVPACIRLTAHTDDGTLVGTLPDVIEALRKRGWKVYRDVLGSGPIKGEALNREGAA